MQQFEYRCQDIYQHIPLVRDLLKPFHLTLQGQELSYEQGQCHHHSLQYMTN